MKAVVYYEYGSPDVLQLEEVERPSVRAEVALKPRNLGFDVAAAVPLAGLTALEGLRD